MKSFPPASKASREVANLTERKNPQSPGVWCQKICLSVCRIDPSSNLALTLTRPIPRGVLNLLHKFHLYLTCVNFEVYLKFQKYRYLEPQTGPND